MATETVKTLEVPCPYCGDADASIALDLNDLTACQCRECGLDFSPSEALEKSRKSAERWQAVVTWIESAPTK